MQGGGRANPPGLFCRRRGSLKGEAGFVPGLFRCDGRPLRGDSGVFGNLDSFDGEESKNRFADLVVGCRSACCDAHLEGPLR